MQSTRTCTVRSSRRQETTGVNFSQPESIVSCIKKKCNGRSFGGVAGGKSKDVESGKDRHQKITPTAPGKREERRERMQSVQGKRKKKEKKKFKQSQMRRKEKNRERKISRSKRIERRAVNYGGVIGPSLVYRVLPFTPSIRSILEYRVLFPCRARNFIIAWGQILGDLTAVRSIGTSTAIIIRSGNKYQVPPGRLLSEPDMSPEWRFRPPNPGFPLNSDDNREK